MTYNAQQKEPRKHIRTNSLSTSIVMLTPPPIEEIHQENRRLSLSQSSNTDHNLLSPPPETDLPPKPEEIVHKLIDDRRASTITLLSDAIKNIFIQRRIKEDGIPVEISSNIYLGSIGAAHNIQWLKDNKITHVLCVAGGIQACFPKLFIYKIIDIVDAPSIDIREYFNEAFLFIDECINNNGRVLVHCFAGMSRSVAIVTAYLMNKYKMCAISALTLVRSKRKQANPNAGFIVQLLRYQKSLGISTKKKNYMPKFIHGNAASSSNTNSKLSLNKKKKTRDIFRRRKKRQNAVTFANVTEYKKRQNLTVHITSSASGDSGTETEESISALDTIDHHIIDPCANNNNNLSQMSHNRGISLDSSENRNPMSLHPNMQVLEQWETGRRPSIFSALARLRALKMRSQSSESIASSHVSDEPEQESDDTLNATHNMNNSDNNMLVISNNTSVDMFSLPTINTENANVNIVIGDDDDDRLSVASTGITPAASPLSVLERLGESPIILPLISSRVSPVVFSGVSDVSPLPTCITPTIKLELLKEVSIEDDVPLMDAFAIAVADNDGNGGRENENIGNDESKNDDEYESNNENNILKDVDDDVILDDK